MTLVEQGCSSEGRIATGIRNSANSASVTTSRVSPASMLLGDALTAGPFIQP